MQLPTGSEPDEADGFRKGSQKPSVCKKLHAHLQRLSVKFKRFQGVRHNAPPIAEFLMRQRPIHVQNWNQKLFRHTSVSDVLLSQVAATHQQNLDTALSPLYTSAHNIHTCHPSSFHLCTYTATESSGAPPLLRCASPSETVCCLEPLSFMAACCSLAVDMVGLLSVVCCCTQAVCVSRLLAPCGVCACRRHRVWWTQHFAVLVPARTTGAAPVRLGQPLW